MTLAPTKRRGGGITPETDVARAVRALVMEVGEVEAAKRLDMGRSTITRLAAALPCRRASIALARQRLGLG